MEPAKQLKVMKEFQKQSAQMDMTVTNAKYLFTLKMLSCLQRSSNLSLKYEITKAISIKYDLCVSIFFPLMLIPIS